MSVRRSLLSVPSRVLLLAVPIAMIAILAKVSLSERTFPIAGASGAPSGFPSCVDADPPCPPILAPSSLTAPATYAAGWRLDPPPTGSPTIDARTAVGIAWYEDGQGPAPDQSAQAIYAQLPAGGTVQGDEPVWLVRFTGACVALVVPPNAPTNLPPCVPSEWDVLVDAQTGDFIAGFSGQTSEPEPSGSGPISTPAPSG